jgi:phage-related holin
MSLKLLIMTLIVINILEAIQKYFFTEIDLLPYLFLSILVDMVAGMVRAHLNGTLCVAEAFKKPVIKVIQYGCLLLIVNTLAHANLFTHEADKYLAWLPRAAAVYLILMEMRSALQHLSGNKNIPVDAINTIIDMMLRKNKLNNNNTDKSNNKNK